MSTIGSRIRSRREFLGMTQAELCEKLHYKSRATINKIESGQRNLTQPKIKAMADALSTTPSYIMGWTDEDEAEKLDVDKEAVRIPVLGDVAAGVPINAIEDILDWEEITAQQAKSGEFFALRIKGDSMSPRILDGDVVVVKRQPDADTGSVVIAKVNGDEACCKKLVKNKSGITLQSFNPTYEPMYFDKKEIEKLPVSIIGKVVELRGKF